MKIAANSALIIALVGTATTPASAQSTNIGCKQSGAGQMLSFAITEDSKFKILQTPNDCKQLKGKVSATKVEITCEGARTSYTSSYQYTTEWLAVGVIDRGTGVGSWTVSKAKRKKDDETDWKSVEDLNKSYELVCSKISGSAF